MHFTNKMININFVDSFYVSIIIVGAKNTEDILETAPLPVIEKVYMAHMDGVV